MNLKIIKAILFDLDVNKPTLQLSDKLLRITDVEDVYISNLLLKVLKNDSAKKKVLSIDNRFLTKLNNIEEDFVIICSDLAKKQFEVMHRNKDIPNASVVYSLVEIMGELSFVFLKLDYTETFKTIVEEGVFNIVIDQLQLPKDTTNLKEAYVINLINRESLVVEKKYLIDEEKNYYLSELIGMYDVISPKEKVDIFLKNAVKTNKVYSEKKETAEADLISALHDEVTLKKEINIDYFIDDFFANNEVAKREIKSNLMQDGIEIQESIPMSETLIKKMSKQVFKNKAGIEVKIPRELYGDESQVEIVTDNYGVTKITVKNIKV